MIITNKHPNSDKIKDFTESLLIKPKVKLDPNWHNCVKCNNRFYSKGKPKYCVDCKPL